METQPKQIDLETARKLLEPGGPLSLLLKGYEFRSEQQEMLEAIIQAFNQERIALIEAETGTGKSIAYLIPALLWSAQNKERTLISTNTISLQEQLLHKDIPLASKILNFPVKAVLVKGMSNYVCLRKLADAAQEMRALPDREREYLEMAQDWSQTTQDGCLSQLPISPSRDACELICADSDSCTQRRCPFFNQCFFFKARKEAEDAQLLIANHALLFADLAVRNRNERVFSGGLLPDYTRLILDEAHHLEQIATSFFSDRVVYTQVLRWLNKLGGEKQGKLSTLSQKLLQHYPKKIPHEASNLLTRLTIDAPALRRELLLDLAHTFHAFLDYIDTANPDNKDGESAEVKFRLHPHHIDTPIWQTHIIPEAEKCLDKLNRYVQTIESLDKDISSLKDPKLEELTENVRQEIKALLTRLLEVGRNLAAMIQKTIPESTVRWIETRRIPSGTLAQLIQTDLNMAALLANSIFNRFPTTILCSATLTTNHSFAFIKMRLGLTSAHIPNKEIQEKIFHSPFNYTRQALLLLPEDMPNPKDADFARKACEKIQRAVQASKGNAFVLFTSYAMLKKCYDSLKNALQASGYTLFKQGDAPRSRLLEEFKQTDRSILFGTDSFWEGVDVAGEALRCVILVKLPFKTPNDPITEARSELIANAGGDPFMDYAIPHAIVKFKQGFGRLIRNKRDRGCIVCLDSRIIKSNYGRLFLNSLPHCARQVTKSNDELENEMESFYKLSRTSRFNEDKLNIL